jgi:hypothetical protein
VFVNGAVYGNRKRASELILDYCQYARMSLARAASQCSVHVREDLSMKIETREETTNEPEVFCSERGWAWQLDVER